VDVDHRDVERPGADAALDGHLRFAAADETHVCTRAADIDGDQIVEPGRLADPSHSDHAGRRPGQRGVDRLRPHDVGADDAAVGLHDRQRCSDPSGAQLLHQARDVAADERLHVGVEDGAHRPLELAEHRQHLAGQRHGAARVLLTEQRGGAPLVRGVGVAVQEAHGDRAHAGLAQPAGRRAHAGLVEGRELLALDGDAAVDLEDQLGGHRPRRLHPREHVGAAGDVVAADLEHVAEAGGGEQARGRALALEDRVGGGRRAVQHVT
jgi:hypothetical protein